MGGCATRDLIKHDMDKFSNNINDQYFFKKLDLSYLIELDDIKSQIHAGEILEKIINHRKYLKNYFSSFEKKLASKKISKLIIEVQKAKDIRAQGLCTGDPKLFAEVEYSPLKLLKKTEFVDSDCPAWFFLIIQKERLEMITSLIFKLYEKYSNETNVLGRSEVLMSELADQELYSK